MRSRAAVRCCRPRAFLLPSLLLCKGLIFAAPEPRAFCTARSRAGSRGPPLSARPHGGLHGSGAAAAPLPCSDVSPLPLPAVLGCCCWQPLPRRPSLAHRAGCVPAAWPQPGASSAAGDLHRFLLSLSEPSAGPRGGKGKGAVRGAMRSRTVSFQGRAASVRELRRGAVLLEPLAGRCCCPSSALRAAAFRGCRFPSCLISLNKALKWGSGFAGFYYRINIHLNPFQKLTPFSSYLECLRRAVTLPKCLIFPI